MVKKYKLIHLEDKRSAKEVKIHEAAINREDYDLIVSKYENEYGADTEKMFRELYREVGE